MRIKSLVLALGATFVLATSVHAQTVKVFVGGQERPEVMRELFAKFMAANPGVKIDLETGCATSELQQKYLNTVLSAGDSTLDVFLIDIIRPAQYASAGWIESLDKYLGADRDKVMGQYLPAFADAMFLYYRKDLLAKYKLAPPKTWDELATVARTIQAGEKNPELQGISFQGKAIEGAVCTFLLPYWSQGGELITNGKLSLDKPKAEAGLAMWRKLVDQGVAKKNIAEVATDDTRKEFQAGNVLFAVNWGYAWNHFQDGADSSVKDKVGVVSLPAMAGGKPASCIGGWQWAVSSYSKNKEASAKLVRWLSSPEVSKQLAIKASNLPVYPSVYQDKEVLAANGWFADALPVVQSARSRPVTPRYSEVSEAVRVNTNAVMAGVKTPAAGVAEIENRVKRILR